MAMKMLMNMKVSILKEFAEKLEKSELMSNELKESFEKQYEEWKEQSKHITKTLNKMNNKKKNNTTSSSSDEESNDTNNVKKEKRIPTEHQTRVSKCMNLLKEKYPGVKHQIRLGTANYMATYIKNEFENMDFETEPEKVEQAMQYATKKMNENKGEEIFTESPPVEKNEEEERDTTEDEKPADEKNNKKNKKTKKQKKNDTDNTD